MIGMSQQIRTLVELFAHNATVRAESPAVICEDRPYTHRDVYQAIRRQAAALSAAGVSKGDRIVLLAGNRPEVLVLLGAAAWLGAVLVPINLRLSASEVAQQAEDCAPVLVIVEATCAALWKAAWTDRASHVPVMELPVGQDGVLGIVGEALGPEVPRQDAPGLAVIMLYTAAVQGHARGAMLSHEQLLASCAQTGQVWSLNPADRWLGVLPLFHAAGIGLALALLYSGGTCVLLPRFDAAAAVAATARHQITVCTTFAPMLEALLDAADALDGGRALSSLRHCMGLEAPATIQRLSRACPSSRFWSAYGQAEVSSMVCLGLYSERAGSAGRPVPPTKVRIQDAAGHPLPAGVEGEIAVCGPTVFLGYWESALRGPFRPGDDWHRTGDLGRLDEDGWLWFTGRAAHKQLIKTGGENVYPAEVEQVLLEHPAVAEAFVFGRPDDKWGESVHAVCALKSGASVTEAELQGFVESRIARYKRPKSVGFRPAPLSRIC